MPHTIVIGCLVCVMWDVVATVIVVKFGVFMGIQRVCCGRLCAYIMVEFCLYFNVV
jgi:hypothetical protein